MKFRKRPIMIEAVQWGANCRFSEVPDWLSGAIGVGPSVGGTVRMGDVIQVFTLEGVMIANPGDWIIRGLKGEIYPCKPDIFEATYEPVATKIRATPVIQSKCNCYAGPNDCGHHPDCPMKEIEG